jgi:hypothetical protein
MTIPQALILIDKQLDNNIQTRLPSAHNSYESLCCSVQLQVAELAV